MSHVLLESARDRVTLRLDGGGPLGGVIADAGLDGTVRGYVRQPRTELPPRDDGKLDVGGAVGRDGEIEVIRSHAPYGDPYASSVQLVSGEIAEDLSAFLYASEQIPSAVLLGVAFEPGAAARRVRAAGGVVLQALPGAEDAALTLLEANVRAFGQFTERLAATSLLQAMEELTWGLELEVLTRSALPLSFRCRCNLVKALEALSYFSPVEREQMIRDEGGAEVVCHWCGEARWLAPEQIRGLTRPEIRCPDCDALWLREGVTTMVRDDERCACGRRVELPA